MVIEVSPAFVTKCGRPACYGVAFADAELNLLLWVLQEETKTARQDIKGIAYVAMAVPRHGLSWRQLQFANSKAGLEF